MLLNNSEKNNVDIIDCRKITTNIADCKQITGNVVDCKEVTLNISYLHDTAKQLHLPNVIFHNTQLADS